MSAGLDTAGQDGVARPPAGAGDAYIRCVVSGRVQGVYYRAATREQALRLGLSGYARNLPDGRVEVLACGPADALVRLRAWLLRGPPQARVDGVDCAPAPAQPLSGFRAL